MNYGFLFALGAATALAPVQAHAAETCEGTPGGGNAKLILEATTLRNNAGEVAFAIYPDDKSRFLAKGAKVGRARVSAASPRACFWMKPGHYAVAQYHDENGDHKFNRTLFVPKEGFGFSNDAPTSIGLPSFDAVRTALPASGAVVRMKMRYRR
ncbi:MULTISPECIES: DUF2141 domain-containing protein [unclassified Sphingomonas]|jgi:uncharacterized protein (DUF2141 family)|uniref:DUF2141 domain-containing protein n=1 Tax=unclassified Sphingomonas TaxID=196159 RepID=UPI0006F503D7|nr:MULTISPECIES: DUF2141 domain-containing protein [unclassified Sphingomonas]KQN28284.1 hypothetical protein ASF00_10440 [Sphingomonas sp. Leaf34]KQN29733.1 hypothetical protein ASE88_12815 [Sphingomonas sp. Leaf38]